MPKFFYIARDKKGIKKSGAEDALTQEELTKKLQAQNLIVVSIFQERKEGISESVQTAPKVKFRLSHGRITRDDLVLFCRQLATLLGAGVTILRSLEIISKQVSSRRLQSVIRDLAKKMESGFSFHEAMTKHSNIFSKLWVNLVESGEASGSLALVLNRLAGYLERKAAFRRKVVSAALYPIILSIIAVCALMFMALGIIPKFAELFSTFKITLHPLTRTIIAVSGFLIKYKFIIIFLIIGSHFTFRAYVKTKEGRRNWEKFLFSLPLLGDFFRTIIFERFTSEMATLIESGVPILYSLEIAERSVGSITAEEIISKVKDDVRDGKPLNQPLEKSGFFDPMSVQMIATGEEIGELSIMFKRLNTYYQEYIDTFLIRLTSLFEPMMIVVLGIAIGIMVVGMFLPIFQISQLAG
ncbi:MAG: type II secretion system F family protein [Candidatus Omnitrophota bacterium]